MNISEIEDKITDRTKAIMAVHIYGLPVDMDPLIALAEKYNLYIIEDAAELIGQTYKTKPCGSFGDISTFSFYPNKHITTGEGGMVVTNNSELAEKCKSIRNLCFKPEQRFVHEELGWNFRMSNIQAAVGLAQLEQLEFAIKRKREIGETYNNLFNNFTKLQLPLTKTNYSDNIYWVYGLVCKNNCDTKKAMYSLKKKNVGTRPFFWPMHEQPVFHKMGLFQGESYPVAEKLARKGFYIPSGLGITNQQISRVANTVLEVF